jgi:hypothetical protein
MSNCQFESVELGGSKVWKRTEVSVLICSIIPLWNLCHFESPGQKMANKIGSLAMTSSWHVSLQHCCCLHDLSTKSHQSTTIEQLMNPHAIKTCKAFFVLCGWVCTLIGTEKSKLPYCGRGAVKIGTKIKRAIVQWTKVFSIKTCLKHDIWYNEPQVMLAFF